MARKIEFQKRHFQFIADTLKASKPEAHWDANKMAQWHVSVSRFADALRSTNENFKRDTFLAACGVED